MLDLNRPQDTSGSESTLHVETLKIYMGDRVGGHKISIYLKDGNVITGALWGVDDDGVEVEDLDAIPYATVKGFVLLDDLGDRSDRSDELGR